LSTSATKTAIALPVALALTLIAGVFGLPTLLFDYPSFPFSLVGIGWKIATVGVMLLAARRWNGDVIPTEPARRERAPIAIIGVVALTALSFSWDSIPGLRELSAAGSAASYDAGGFTTAIVVFELVARYPATVLAEEAFFRGYLQPRITSAAPVVTGVLFALYHLQQFETIPSLIPFGIALGLLRWWLGTIWPGVVFHYAGNAIFILSLRS
jgi:membrane protease YdiL (CAAX protease family)